MSALCGAVSWLGDPLGPAALARVQETLAPFGTAQEWQGRAGPCDVRLSFMGPAPSTAASESLAAAAVGQVVVVADSHLHRRKEITQRLGLPATSPDHEIIRAAYERWGDACVDHLSGPFAFAVVDRRRGGVLLVRDHAGERSLSLHVRDGVVAFATTSLALTGFPGVGHDLDVDRVAEILVLGYASERTLVRGVRSLSPGCAAWIDGRGMREWRWWPGRELPIRDVGSLEGHARELREHLEVAVEDALDGATAVGALLSGGLDSTSVAALAARKLAPQPVFSYTSVPPPGWSGFTDRGWIPDERFAVEALAARVPNLEPQFVDVEYGPLFEAHEPLWELGCIPIRNPLNLLWFDRACRLAADRSVDVMLTGAAGNLAFSADGPLWLAELVRSGHAIRAVREARTFARVIRSTTRRVLRREVLGVLAPWVRRPRFGAATTSRAAAADRVASFMASSAIHPDLLAKIDLAAVVPDIVNPHPRGFTRDLPRLFLNMGAQSELHTAGRALWGLELRDPTADRHVVELAATQPEWWRRHAGVGRAICRAAMRDVLPPEIVDRQTLGAQQPDWLDRLSARRSEVLAELEAMRDHPLSRELIDVPRLEALAADWPDRDRMAEPEIVAGYDLAMGRAIGMSRYLRWFEERGRRVAGGGPAVVLART